MSSENLFVCYIYYCHSASPVVLSNSCLSFPPCQNTLYSSLFSFQFPHDTSGASASVRHRRQSSMEFLLLRTFIYYTDTMSDSFFLFLLVSTSSPVELPSPCMTTSPCVNGGTCIMRCEAPGYTCVCREGYTGQDCETELS